MGQFDGTTDFDPGEGEEYHTTNGSDDAFILKLSSAGDFLWCRTTGGTASDQAFAVAVSNSGVVYVMGEFTDTVDFDPGPGQDLRTADGSNNLFVTTYDLDGNYLWTNTLDTNMSPYGSTISVDPITGRLLIGSSFRGTVDLDPGPGQHVVHSHGSQDAFVSVWSADGEYLWSRVVGGTRIDGSHASYDPQGRVLMFGTFADTVDFNEGGTPDLRTSNGGQDAFLTRLSGDGDYEWTMTWGGPGDEESVSFGVGHDNGDITLAGVFQQTVDFDPGPGVYELTAVGNRDMFLLRLGCPDSCPQLTKHKARGLVGAAKSKVKTTLTNSGGGSAGGVTVEYTGDAGPVSRTKALDADGKAVVKFKNLTPGEYTCVVTQLIDADGNPLCDGEFLPRAVTVQ